MTARDKSRVELTRCEAEVMAVVWDKGCVTVGDVVEGIGRSLAYTTVMTTMKILEEKRVIERGEKIGRAFTYLPLVSRQAVRTSMLQSLAEQLFGGSTRDLVLSLVQSEAVTAEDLETLRRAAEDLERTL